MTARASDFASWRAQARRLVEAAVRPEDVQWDDGVQASLFGMGHVVVPEKPTPATSSQVAKVPAAFLEKAAVASFHGDPQKYAVLYRPLWKLTRVDGKVLEDPLDPDTERLRRMLRDVAEEEHDMHAFVRFRQRGDRWVAWYRPRHPVLPRVAPFFARRYPSMPWTLFTPEASAHWDGVEIHYGPGAGTDVAPPPDALDDLFVTSRIRAQLPEGAVMSRLARESVTRVSKLSRRHVSASPALLPERRDLDSLRTAACDCRACPIGERATQMVFGEGPPNAQLVIVGEQPGDEEDRAGRPFVGPAGRLLDELLASANLPRDQIYVTNAVKHFKWEPRGKRRLHSRPIASEMDACKGWLLAEIEAIQPRMILCLGATAAQSFAGSGFRVSRDRGKPTGTPWSEWWMASYHPSAMLRAANDAERRALESTLREDLVLTRQALDARCVPRTLQPT